MKGYIFDLDGTLFDSLDVWEQIDREFLEKRNIPVPSDYIDAVSSMTFAESAEYTIKRFGLSDSPQSLMQEWNDMAVHAYQHTVQLKAYVQEYLNILRNRGAKLAVATCLFPALYQALLRKHGIYDLFHVICDSEEAGCGKSQPDMFLLAAKKLNLPPDNCIVFEDILSAVQSAKKAGMTVYGVYDKTSENEWEEIKKIADGIIYDFREAPLP